jgi:vacuolar protein sorting-associated protein 13A/C
MISVRNHLAGAEAPEDDGHLGRFERLKMKIVDNIQLSIKNVHVRYEES